MDPAQAPATPWRDDLIAVIRTRSFRRGRFTLASGRESDLYFNLKPTMMDPRGAALMAAGVLEALAGERPTFLGGVAVGAIPVLGAVAALSFLRGQPLRTFFVRMTVKDHGTRDLIEGLAPDESLTAASVTILEDTTTTGGSILKAVAATRAAGAFVDRALVIVDRQEGAAEALAERGVRLTGLLTAADFA